MSTLVNFQSHLMVIKDKVLQLVEIDSNILLGNVSVANCPFIGLSFNLDVQILG